MNADGETVTINPNAVTTNATVKPDPYVGIHDELTMFVAGPQTIPYGTKKVSVDIRLDANKEGLWGGQLYIAYNSKWNVDFNAVEKTGTGIVNGNLWAGVGATSTYNIVSYDAVNSKQFIYFNEEGNELVVDIMQNNVGAIMVDNENQTYEELIINDRNVHFFYDNEENYGIGVVGNNKCVVSVQGHLPREELLKIFENIK